MAAGARAARQLSAGITRREQEVLQNLAQGLTRDEIGLQMHISVNTVKSMIKSIYNKLNAANRADAIHIAGMIGLIA
ncbi:MAG: response regulator transcription factor [Ruminococcaceae bacterium]|nr:response regulator transcription factor [Oscillospiraceae bacterium]